MCAIIRTGISVASVIRRNAFSPDEGLSGPVGGAQAPPAFAAPVCGAAREGVKPSGWIFSENFTDERLILASGRIWLSRYGSAGRYCGYEHARQISGLQSLETSLETL